MNLTVFNNSILQTAIISWFIAQVLKFIIYFLKYKHLDLSRFVGSGGMPSSHSAFCVSLAAALGFTEGFESSIFGLAAAFSIVVMYDATGVRRSVGQQAAILNKTAEEAVINNVCAEKKLKELIGHRPTEVFAGALLGIVIAVIRYV